MSDGRVIRNAHRDPVSNAVINDDQDGYETARRRKKLAEERLKLKNTVSSLRAELSDVHDQIEEMRKMIAQMVKE